MTMRRLIAGGLAAGALLCGALSASAADLSYTPATITYGVHSTTRATGLTPRGAYVLQIYDPHNVPLIPGGAPFVADATGAWTSGDFDPPPTILPGVYLFEVDQPPSFLDRLRLLVGR